MKRHGKTVTPRLPKAVREKLKSGSGHKSKKDYNRQREQSALRKLIDNL